MKKFLILTAVLSAVLMTSFVVYAAVTFNVRVTNQTGQTVVIQSVMVKPKGAAMASFCSVPGASDFPTIKKGKYSQCSAKATAKKWRRRIIVTYRCQQNNVGGTVTFPRNGKWFSRKHLKNNPRYDVKLKAGDC